MSSPTSGLSVVEFFKHEGGVFSFTKTYMLDFGWRVRKFNDEPLSKIARVETERRRILSKIR